MSKVKLGVIGVGNMGTGHLSNYIKGSLPEIEVTAVADRRADRRQWAKDNLPESVTIFEEGSDLIASGLCEAVLIATPHYQHPTLAIEAFQHKMHVMCEKPAGVYTKAVREMNEAAKAAPTKKSNSSLIPANSVKSAASTGSSPTGTAPRSTTIPAPGVLPGPARAAACC